LRHFLHMLCDITVHCVQVYTREKFFFINWFVDDVRRSGSVKCRELPVSVECPVTAHQSTLGIKRAVYRTSSANTSRDYSETDISGRIIELCPRKSTCRFDLAARDITAARTTQRAARDHDNHIDISYRCQSTASSIIQPTNYEPRAPGRRGLTTMINTRLLQQAFNQSINQTRQFLTRRYKGARVRVRVIRVTYFTYYVSGARCYA